LWHHLPRSPVYDFGGANRLPGFAPRVGNRPRDKNPALPDRVSGRQRHPDFRASRVLPRASKSPPSRLRRQTRHLRIGIDWKRSPFGLPARRSPSGHDVPGSSCSGRPAGRCPAVRFQHPLISPPDMSNLIAPATSTRSSRKKPHRLHSKDHGRGRGQLRTRRASPTKPSRRIGRAPLKPAVYSSCTSSR
jgi:hypothetical protein